MAPRNGRPGYISSISRNARANSPAQSTALFPPLFYPTQPTLIRAEKFASLTLLQSMQLLEERSAKVRAETVRNKYWDIEES